MKIDRYKEIVKECANLGCCESATHQELVDTIAVQWASYEAFVRWHYAVCNEAAHILVNPADALETVDAAVQEAVQKVTEANS